MKVGAIKEIAAARAAAETQAADSLQAQIRAEEEGAGAAQRAAGDSVATAQSGSRRVAFDLRR